MPGFQASVLLKCTGTVAPEATLVTVAVVVALVLGAGLALVTYHAGVWPARRHHSQPSISYSSRSLGSAAPRQVQAQERRPTVS